MSEPRSLEATLEFDDLARKESDASDNRPSPVAPVRLTEGTRPSLAAETAQLLSKRLRATAFVLTIGLAIFLARVLTVPNPNQVWLRIFVLLLAIACLVRLFGKRMLTLHQRDDICFHDLDRRHLSVWYFRPQYVQARRIDRVPDGRGAARGYDRSLCGGRARCRVR